MWTAMGPSSAAQSCVARACRLSRVNLISSPGGPQSCCLLTMACVTGAELMVPCLCPPAFTPSWVALAPSSLPPLPVSLRPQPGRGGRDAQVGHLPAWVPTAVPRVLPLVPPHSPPSSLCFLDSLPDKPLHLCLLVSQSALAK